MKHKNSIVTISLNILFCAALLWFFSRNAFLRPYLGSTAKEFLSGLLLLVTLYANYFVFYPKLRRGHTLVYWLSVVATSLMAGCVELALGYQFISKCQAVIIAKVGPLLFQTFIPTFRPRPCLQPLPLFAKGEKTAPAVFGNGGQGRLSIRQSD